MWQPALEDALGSPDSGRLRSRVSVEITPRQLAAAGDELDLLPAGTAVYVPWLPGADTTATLSACRTLRERELRPVPHLPARRLSSFSQADRFLGQLAESGCADLFVIAGDGDGVAGPFKDSLDLLDSGLVSAHGFRRLGIAGYPEPHPRIPNDRILEALRYKREYATRTATTLWVVTQFVTRARVFTRWLDRMHAELGPLPVYFGLAGPTSPATLLRYAKLCGVGTSARRVFKNPALASLAFSWRPADQLRAVEEYHRRQPASALCGYHLFPFGGLAQCLAWLDSMNTDGDDEGGRR